MTDEQRAEEFLQTQHHMVLAVVQEDGSPWAVPDTPQHRDGLRVFEWDSRTDAVHSLALARDSRAAITLYPATVSDEWREIGFYAAGRAGIIDPRGDFARYRFTTERAWVNDETHMKRELHV